MEVLRNRKSKTLRLAPLFDHGLSLMCRCHTHAEIAAYDVMEDKPVQTYVGFRSAKENLNLIPADKMPALNPLQEEDRDLLLNGLEHVLPTLLLDKIWDMIWKRWCYYDDFCHSR